MAPPLLLDGVYPAWCPEVLRQVIALALTKRFKKVCVVTGLSHTGTSLLT